MSQVTDAATFCATLVDSWARFGVSDAIVCPGSRSTPMAVALDEHPDLRVHVHVDERSAGFMALGLGVPTGRPAVVLTTSGTAAVNLHPAVAEAGEAAVPLIACTADRPPELHGVGAPQTTDQQDLYGSATRLFVDAGVPDAADRGAWRGLAARVHAGAVAGTPGPVQLNLPFREPLVGRPGDLPEWSRPGTADVPRAFADRDLEEVVDLVDGRRVVVVAGHPVDAAAVTELAEARAWPLLIDPRSGIVAPPGVAHFDALLRSDQFADTSRPDVVLRVGSLPASKVLGEWLDELPATQIGVDRWGRTFDPGGSLSGVLAAEPGAFCRRLSAALDGRAAPDRTFAQRWRAADRIAEQVIDEILTIQDASSGDTPSGGDLSDPAVARLLTRAWPQEGSIVAASSMPIRDLEWYGARTGLAVHANRGINGIDGVISTAVGVALARAGPVACLLGDLAFLHDHSGLLGLASRGVDLLLVVVDNDGGGIFGFLPQATALPKQQFERLFGTPHGLDLVAVAAASGVPARSVDRADRFVAAVDESIHAGGVQVIVVATDRHANIGIHDMIHRHVLAALDGAFQPD